jgi:hypothetical protein
MKNKIYPILLIIISLGVLSCNKEDSNLSLANSKVKYDEIEYSLTNGIYIDYGSYNYYGTADTHHNYDFYTTNGTFVADDKGQLIDIKGDIVIYAYMESFGSNTFKEGTFNYIDVSEDTNLTDAQRKTKYENKSFFIDASVITGKNSNGSLSSGKEVLVKAGTITIKGIKPNFTITYDLELVNNKTVKGSYTGLFSEFKD